MGTRTRMRSKTALIEHYGEMWDRNSKNIGDVPGHREHGRGVYILYDGSTPVYVGKGNIQARLRKENNKSKRLGNSWDHFSWFLIRHQDEDLIHDVEVLLLRILPPYLRYMTRQRGKFKGSPAKHEQKNSTRFRIER